MRRVAVILLLLAAVVGLLLLETETGRAREPDAPRAPPREAGHARLASAPAEEEAPPESAAIRGLVRDADGLPAPGARVRLFPDRAGGAPDAWRDLAPDAPSPRATAAADGLGRFAFAASRDTPWILVADAKGHVPAVALVPRGDDGAERVLTLARGETHALRVVDAEGRPLAAAEALVFQGAETVRASARADAGGRIEVAVAPQDLVLVRAPGFTWELIDPPLAEPEIVLDREYRVGGVVLTAAGEPVRGVVVTVERYLWLERQLTSDDGRFLFAGLGEGEVDLALEPPGDEWLRETVQSGDERLRIVLPTARIEGTIVLRDGTPAAGASVGTGRRGATCDDRGRFVLGRLRPGDMRIRASLGGEHEGHADVTLPAAGLTGVRIVLAPVEVVRSFVAVRMTGPPGVLGARPSAKRDGKPCGGRWEDAGEGRGTLRVDAPPGSEVTLHAMARDPGDRDSVPWLGVVHAVTSRSPGGPEIVLALRPPVEVTVACRAGDGGPLPSGVEPEITAAWARVRPAESAGRRRLLVPCDPDGVTIHVTASGYLPAQVGCRPEQGAGIEVRLQRAARVTGRFLDDIDWLVSGGRASFAARGFVIEAEPGTAIDIVAGKGPVPGLVRTIEVPAHSDLDLGDLALDAPIVGKGFVVDAGDSPVGGAAVRATGLPREWAVTTRGDGSFTILLPRTDLVRVEVEKDRLVADPVPVASFLKGPQTIRLARSGP